MSIRCHIVGLLILLSVSGSFANQCGAGAEGALCPEGLCCSRWGWCGDTEKFCGEGCQSQCDGSDSEDSKVTTVIPEETFEKMLRNRNYRKCQAIGFYTYDAFVSAATNFSNFGATGNNETRKRELAAFFAQTSFETAGAVEESPHFPGDKYVWGYCNVTKELPWLADDYCTPSTSYPCVPGKKYYGRGPFQLEGNYNYGKCGEALGVDLLKNPDLLVTDPVISFKSAIWFWMTPRRKVPSCHEVITGEWTPTDQDKIEGRFPGYGLLTNIINGIKECGKGYKQSGEDRIGYYLSYCNMLDVDYYRYDLDCYHQKPFNYDLRTSGEGPSITSI